MAGLNNLISNVGTQTTTLPSWYDSAQQNLVSNATQAFNAAPQPGQTVAQGAVNTLSGPANPFNAATGTLQTIAQGAANPWIVNPTTGAVTPDTNTAMGGLFKAQTDYLNAALPDIAATPTASAIGSGSFGSRMNIGAAEKAKANAINQLFANQNQTALSNQATGVNAGIGAGTVANQGLNQQLAVGQYQQAAPFSNVANYGKVLGTVQAPTTVSNQTQLSPLNQMAGLYGLLGGSGATSLLGQAGTTLSGLFSGLGGGTTGNPLDNVFSNTVNMGNTDVLPEVLPGDISSAPGFDWNSIDNSMSDLGSAASGVNLGGLLGF
jgi:hypothetical protein